MLQNAVPGQQLLSILSIWPISKSWPVEKETSVLPAIRGLVHEAPLQSRRETGATTSTETGFFHFVQDPFMTLEQNLLGLVPVATLECAIELIVVESVNVGENAILV